MKFKIDKLNDYIDKSQNINSGMDFLRVKLDGYISHLDKVFDVLDYDNSNFYTEKIHNDKITYIKGDGKQGRFLIASTTYNGYSVPLFAYTEYSDGVLKLVNKHGGNTIGKFDFYGSFFRLMEIGGIDFELIEKIIDKDWYLIESGRITRLDYKFDFLFEDKAEILKLEDFIKVRKNGTYQKYTLDDYEEKKIDSISDNEKESKNMKKNKSKCKKNTVRDYYKNREVSTWIYGNRESKRRVVRCYDKLLDTAKKGKFVLYKDYFEYESVYRLEFELLNKYCKPYTFQNKDRIVGKLFKELDGRFAGKLYYHYEDVELTSKSKIEKMRYFKDFGGRGYKIAQAGINPFIILYNQLQEKESSFDGTNVDIDRLVDKFREYLNA